MVVRFVDKIPEAKNFVAQIIAGYSVTEII